MQIDALKLAIDKSILYTYTTQGAFMECKNHIIRTTNDHTFKVIQAERPTELLGSKLFLIWR